MRTIIAAVAAIAMAVTYTAPVYAKSWTKQQTFQVYTYSDAGTMSRKVITKTYGKGKNAKKTYRVIDNINGKVSSWGWTHNPNKGKGKGGKGKK